MFLGAFCVLVVGMAHSVSLYQRDRLGINSVDMLGIQTQGTEAKICVSEALYPRVLENLYVDPRLVS